MSTGASANAVQCVVVTPERAVLDAAVDFVALPMYDGELGVLPGRRPLIGRLGFGELRTTKGTSVRRFYVDGGFVQIRNNVVTVLTGKAIRAEDIKVVAVEQDLRTGEKPAITEEGIEASLKRQQQLRAQLRVARHLQDPADAGRH